MDKKVIYEYIDARELVRETEEEIRSLKRHKVVQDKVSGSNPEFPYQPQSFNISGIVETAINWDDLEEELKLLQSQRENARRVKMQATQLIGKAPIRIQRIARYKIFQNMKWDEVAAKMGEGKSGDAYRKEFGDYLKEK